LWKFDPERILHDYVAPARTLQGVVSILL
jgi:hypothetical protein